MASENESTKLPPLFHGETGNLRNRGRSRNGKGPKKIPQRGVGIEKLEQMRFTESLRKNHHQQHVLFSGFQFPQQQVILNNNNNNNVVGSGSGSAFSPLVGNNKTGFGNFGVGASSSSSNLFGWFNRNPFENSSKELSSIPNPNHHQSVDLCLKKTRLNEENIMMKGANFAKREMPLEIWKNHHHVQHDFLGFMAQPSVSTYATQNHNEKTNARRKMPMFHGFMAQAQPSVSAYHDECMEVVAVHRKKGSSSFGGAKVFMEYEFFPEKATTTSGEASSSITASTSYGDAYDSLDLSLRL